MASLPIQQITRSRYSRNIRFEDPITSYDNVDAYAMNIMMLKVVPSCMHAFTHASRCVEDQSPVEMTVGPESAMMVVLFIVGIVQHELQAAFDRSYVRGRNHSKVRAIDLSGVAEVHSLEDLSADTVPRASKLSSHKWTPLPLADG